MKRAVLRLTVDCNNSCLFCAQRGLPPASPGAVELRGLLSSLRAQSDELTFAGGEPTLHAGLEGAIADAKALGFKRIGLQTNGRLLGEGGVAARFAKAGLTDVHLSLHGSEPAVHDYHVGVEGAFSQVLAALGAARAHALTIGVTTVLTRSNYRVLAPLPRFLKTTGVAAWVVHVPVVAGALGEAFDKLYPRLGLAVPFALHAIDQARQLQLPAWIRGAPACLLGPLAARAMVDEPRAYGRPCERCPARLHCPGVDKAYLERFGADELTARDAAPPDAESTLSRLFVGTGELVPAIRGETKAGGRPLLQVVPSESPPEGPAGA